MSKSLLLANVIEATAEVAAHDLESGMSGGFVNTNGVFKFKIEKAFLQQSKSGGVQLELFLGGDNRLESTLYVVSKKNGKLTTTYSYQGKTASLGDYKTFKQLYFVATGEPLALSEIDTTVETIKYKKFGKDIEVEAETIDALIGKELQMAIRLKAEYAYDNDAKETDKTAHRTNSDGDLVFKKEIDGVYDVDGFSPLEILGKDDEAKEVEAKKLFLASDKATYYPKLEEAEVEIEEEEEIVLDEIKF